MRSSIGGSAIGCRSGVALAIRPEIDESERNSAERHRPERTRPRREGANLQVANVLVNYDPPWNPMIVEQRSGRVQRLASERANVSIFNIMLQGTLEEYIVGS